MAVAATAVRPFFAVARYRYGVAKVLYCLHRCDGIAFYPDIRI